MSVYFIRHGVTDFNLEGKPAGRKFDESLNEQGRLQALQLAEMRNRFDVILSSPLKRARETVGPLSEKLSIPIQIIEDLTERSHGYLDGKIWHEIAVITDGKMTFDKLHRSLEHDFSLWGGDSIEQARIRIRHAVATINDFWGRRVLVMTHGGVIKVLYALSGDMKPRKIPNISLHEFSWETIGKILNSKI